MFVILLFLGSLLHVYIWSDYFSKHIALSYFILIISVSIILLVTTRFNHIIREKTLKKIIKDMNSSIKPEIVLHKYNACIVDWKKIESPVRTLYRLILNHPLKIWNYHLAEEIGYDKLSKSWKLLGESGKWKLYTGPAVPNEVPIGECRNCNHQIYREDLDELDDKEMGSVCIRCDSTDIDFGRT
jgi:hypothetical protein